MAEFNQNQQIKDLAHELVLEFAPEEESLFSLQSKHYFKNPPKALSLQKKRDFMFGLDLGKTAVFLTPLLLELSRLALCLAEELLKDIAIEKSRGFLGKLLRLLIDKLHFGKRSVKKMQGTVFQAQHLSSIHKHLVEKASELGLEEDKANMLADSIVQKLIAATFLI